MLTNPTTKTKFARGSGPGIPGKKGKIKSKGDIPYLMQDNQYDLDSCCSAGAPEWMA